MANPYKELFSVPGTIAFSLAGLVARMPISMTGIGIITMLSQMKGSYWLAGTVAATFTFTMALIAPQISRAVDRYGQSRVLPIATGISVISIALLLLCAHYGAPDWTLFIFAALSGCMPSMPAMVRARWTEIHRGTPRLHTAYSFESVLDEVCFIIGPPISVGLSIAVMPEAGPLMSAIFLAVGVMVFVMQKSTEPPVHQESDISKESALKPLPMKMLVLALIALGTIVGTIDVISVAFAEQQGQPVAASIVLSVYAVGSCLAGLAFGAYKLNASLPKQFLIASFATAAMTLPLFYVYDIATLSASVFAAGIFFAPTMIIAMGLVESIVPSSKLTEGLTWMITGLGIGVAMGAAVAGWVIDEFGVKAGFMVTIASGMTVLLIAIACYRLLQRRMVLETA
ncbi:MFS transporter [Photobacterium sp. WH77]|uniref:MFS transporter n=1 Tax=unclassified Photobacterium TaxID=2628852 RepID=UPI001C4484A5|nr:MULTISPECIES: MFS transporter [unclassified Photobacterium]MBV7264241.1 MFS transporter [Photobacterium sp. WH24]MCG2838143.1 MFS transporter [Photobacterium sp. WH77]MCG2845761.1 MFS transporter [Photobacterium sp. WH80]MDO6581526.1 MFS transporter [Photobacterium sp. 2_MG-2023]